MITPESQGVLFKRLIRDFEQVISLMSEELLYKDGSNEPKENN
jgi:hypothetical protein